MLRGGEYDVEAPPQHILEKYFGEYSLSTKAHRTHGGPNEFFGDLAHFFLKYVCIYQNSHSMPKKKAGLIILAHEGRKIDWGSITREGVRAAIASFKSGKRFLPVLAQYTVVLYPPEAELPRQPLALPALPPKPKRRHTVPHEEWTEDESPAGSTTHARDNITLQGRVQETPKLTSPRPDQNTSTQVATPRSGGPQLKRGREETSSPMPDATKCRLTDQDNAHRPDPSEVTPALVVAPDMTLVVVLGHTEKGQGSRFSIDDVFTL